MAIEIGDIIQRGYERTKARNGLQLAAILFLLSVLNAMFSLPFERQSPPLDGMGPSMDMAAGAPPVSLGLAPGIAAALSLIISILMVIVTIGALRTLVTEETDILPREHFTTNLLWPVINLIIGSIVFGIVVAIGFILLILPGLFLLISLFFWEVFVAVENDNFIDGFQHSWTLTSGHRVELFILGIVAILLVIVVSIGFAIPAFILPSLVGFLIEEAGSALVAVFLMATIAETYNQLTAD